MMYIKNITISYSKKKSSRNLVLKGRQICMTCCIRRFLTFKGNAKKNVFSVSVQIIRHSMYHTNNLPLIYNIVTEKLGFECC